jgi:hypothetical protein
MFHELVRANRIKRETKKKKQNNFKIYKLVAGVFFLKWWLVTERQSLV